MPEEVSPRASCGVPWIDEFVDWVDRTIAKYAALDAEQQKATTPRASDKPKRVRRKSTTPPSPT